MPSDVTPGPGLGTSAPKSSKGQFEVHWKSLFIFKKLILERQREGGREKLGFVVPLTDASLADSRVSPDPGWRPRLGRRGEALTGCAGGRGWKGLDPTGA